MRLKSIHPSIDEKCRHLLCNIRARINVAVKVIVAQVGLRHVAGFAQGKGQKRRPLKDVNAEVCFSRRIECLRTAPDAGFPAENSHTIDLKSAHVRTWVSSSSALRATFAPSDGSPLIKFDRHLVITVLVIPMFLRVFCIVSSRTLRNAALRDRVCARNCVF